MISVPIQHAFNAFPMVRVSTDHLQLLIVCFKFQQLLERWEIEISVL
jgi:hypothetical protein